MNMQFTLSMEGLVLDHQEIDGLIIQWIEDVTQAEVLEYSRQWISTKNFVAERMQGVRKVEESCLSIEPIAEA